ncbi:MAG: hypothetical protein ACLU3I_06350 [Acutalibacteraceae bacterium]
MAEAKKENFFARTGKRISRWFREMKSELKKSYGRQRARWSTTPSSFWCAH